MPTPTQAVATSTLEEGQAALTLLLYRLSDEQMARAATIGGGDWSAKDLLGHLAFWEELALGFIADWQAGRVPESGRTFADWSGGVDAANTRNQAVSQSQTPEQVRERARTALARVVEAIREISDEQIACAR